MRRRVDASLGAVRGIPRAHAGFLPLCRDFPKADSVARDIVHKLQLHDATSLLVQVCGRRRAPA